MHTFAPKTTQIDVEHRGRRRVIAACLLESEAEAAIVDPGPESTSETLLAKLAKRGIAVDDLTAILLTHIHLDHAAATGRLVALNPRLRVFVHERGARHMIDPTRLLASARRLYGDEMETLWGEFLPVPEESVVVLRGGEQIAVGRRTLRVEYTPGHASHHVSFFEPDTGIAYVGDTAGVRIAGASYVKPPTPPPDIDLPVWEQSIEVIRGFAAERLFVTHFGVAEGVDEHLDELKARLWQWCGWVRESLELEAPDSTRIAHFIERVDREIRERVGDPTAGDFLQSAPTVSCWLGLARFVRKGG